MIRNFKHFDTGEFWEMEDLKQAYNQFDEGKHDTFEAFLTDLMEQGEMRTGGVVPAYIVIHVGGDKDGEVVFCAEEENDCVAFAHDYNEEHEDEPDFLGVDIYDPEDVEVLNWV